MGRGEAASREVRWRSTASRCGEQGMGGGGASRRLGGGRASRGKGLGQPRRSTTAVAAVYRVSK
jgi:hypothetical protein